MLWKCFSLCAEPLKSWHNFTPRSAESFTTHILLTINFPCWYALFASHWATGVFKKLSSRPVIWKRLQESSPINADISFETIVGILQKDRLAFKILSAIFCFVLLSTSLLYNANEASSSIIYHKWHLKLVTAALAMTESMSAYVINEFISKRSFFGPEDEIAADSH